MYLVCVEFQSSFMASLTSIFRINQPSRVSTKPNITFGLFLCTGFVIVVESLHNPICLLFPMIISFLFCYPLLLSCFKMPALEKKLGRELAHDSVVFSCHFPFPGKIGVMASAEMESFLKTLRNVIFCFLNTSFPYIFTIH